MTNNLAYIDPGMGSLAVQALIAAGLAIPFFFRHQVSRLVRSIRRRALASEPSQDVDQGEASQAPPR
jgi:hypothetical protein